MTPKSLSVFFPAYNEEGNIENIVDKTVRILNGYSFPWEIIVIDDGSTDQTGRIADQLARRNPRISVIHQKNGGYGMALRAGFARGKYSWIAYMDSDGQFNFSEIEKFFQILSTADAFWGYRPNRKDPLFRLITSKLWTMSLIIFFGLKLKDVNCGFKMIKKGVVKKLSPLKSVRGGMINAEIAIKLQEKGYRIIQVPLSHFPRTHGRPTGVDLNVILQSYWDLFRLRWETWKNSN